MRLCGVRCSRLALSWANVGRLEDCPQVKRTVEAITLDEQTLAALERVLGPDHPDTLTSRNNLANARQAVDGVDQTDDQDP